MKLFFKKNSVTPESAPKSVGKILSKAIGAALKPHGFSKQGATFYKAQDGLTYIINLQASMWNDRHDSRFYINVGVFHPKVYEIEHGEPVSKYPKEYQSMLRLRLEHLSQDIPPDWQYKAETDIAELSATMTAKIIRYALPYFEQIKTFDDVRRELTSDRTFMGSSIYVNIYLAILAGLEDDLGTATDLLKKYLAQHKYPTNHTKRDIWCIARDLGITLDIPEIKGETCVGFYFPVKGILPVKDERKTNNKLGLFLRNMESKKMGYIHMRGSRREPGQFRLAFGTKASAEVEKYIKDRLDKFPLPLSKIIVDDVF